MIASGRPEASLCLSQSFRVRLAVDKLERIDRDDFGVELFKLAVIEKQRQPFARADAEVIAAVFANLQTIFELAFERCASHPSHLTKTFSVFTTRSSGGTASIRLLFLLNQAIGMQGRVAQRNRGIRTRSPVARECPR